MVHIALRTFLWVSIYFIPKYITTIIKLLYWWVFLRRNDCGFLWLAPRGGLVSWRRRLRWKKEPYHRRYVRDHTHSENAPEKRWRGLIGEKCSMLEPVQAPWACSGDHGNQGCLQPRSGWRKKSPARLPNKHWNTRTVIVFVGSLKSLLCWASYEQYIIYQFWGLHGYGIYGHTLCAKKKDGKHRWSLGMKMKQWEENLLDVAQNNAVSTPLHINDTQNFRTSTFTRFTCSIFTSLLSKCRLDLTQR